MLNIRSNEEDRRGVQEVPMKRMGTVDEVACLVLWLLHERTDPRNGVVKKGCGVDSHRELSSSP
jgi:hypothetical protein